MGLAQMGLAHTQLTDEAETIMHLQQPLVLTFLAREIGSLAK